MATKGFGLVFGIVCFICLHHDVQATPVDQVTEEPKPLTCPSEEKYFKCTLEQCYKTCDHLVHPPPCPSIAAGCYQPGCLCDKDWLRNKDGKCVPWEKCPKKDN